LEGASGEIKLKVHESLKFSETSADSLSGATFVLIDKCHPFESVLFTRLSPDHGILNILSLYTIIVIVVIVNFG